MSPCVCVSLGVCLGVCVGVCVCMPQAHQHVYVLVLQIQSFKFFAIVSPSVGEFKETFAPDL